MITFDQVSAIPAEDWVELLLGRPGGNENQFAALRHYLDAVDTRGRVTSISSSSPRPGPNPLIRRVQEARASVDPDALQDEADAYGLGWRDAERRLPPRPGHVIRGLTDQTVPAASRRTFRERYIQGYDEFYTHREMARGTS